jgi:hypothetical protein
VNVVRKRNWMRNTLQRILGYAPGNEKISPEEQRFPKAFVCLRGGRDGFLLER